MRSLVTGFVKSQPFWVCTLSTLIALSMAGCGTVGGGTLDVIRHAFDVVLIQRLHLTQPNEVCGCSFGKCIESGAILLDEGGNGRHEHCESNDDWIGQSPITECSDEVFLSCGGEATLFCVNPFALRAQGTITIAGNGVGCKKVYEDGFIMVCDVTTIAINIDGDTVSSTASPGSTGSSVVLDLSVQINKHPVISQKVSSVASGNTIFVQSLQGGVQYSYPWQASCTYTQDYFSGCAMSAQVSPIATLALPKSQ